MVVAFQDLPYLSPTVAMNPTRLEQPNKSMESYRGSETEKISPCEPREKKTALLSIISVIQGGLIG